MAPIQSQEILDTKCFLQLKKVKYFLNVSYFFRIRLSKYGDESTYTLALYKTCAITNLN